MKLHRTLVISDLHCGDALGLTPPKFQEDIRPWHKQLWPFYVNTIAQIGRVNDLVINGDAVHGPPRKEASGHSHPDVDDQIDMADDCIGIIKADRRHFVRGTGFHTDGAVKFEDAIADRFGATSDDECRLDVYGILFHYRHVVGRSDTPYGQHTQIQKEIINEMLQADMEDYESADVLIRSHVHYSAGTWLYDARRGHKREAFTTPALSLRAPKTTAFVRKLRTWLYHVGLTLIETSTTGEVFVRPIMLPIKLYNERGYECVTDD